MMATPITRNQNMRDAERLSSLEAENLDLKSRLAVLEARTAPKPRPAPIDDNPVTVVEIQPTLHDGPTPTEFEGLLAIVVRSVFPKLVPDREYLAAFVAAFNFVGTLGRLPGGDLGPRAETWVAAANRTLNWRPEIELSHIASASIAWGDINFSVADWPHSVHVGVCWRSHGAGASSASWRKVLESGAVRRAIITNQKLYDTPQPRVQQLLIRG
jgi:hypothetical protein